MADVKSEKAKKWMHAITWLFLLAALAFSVFYFGLPILERLCTAFVDLGRSLAAYGVLLFTGKDDVILPTVQEIPPNMDAILPLSLEESKLFLAAYWDNFIEGKNILAYLWQVFENIALILSYVFLAIVPLGLIILLLWVTNRGIDNDEKDMRAVRIFEKFRRGVWLKITGAIKMYAAFIKGRRYYQWAFILIWAYNLNALTIIVELVAFIFYLSWVGTIDGMVSGVLVQVAKFAMDFSVAAFFIPGWAWVIIGYWIFCKIRRSLGRKMLQRCIDKDNEFIKKYPGALFVCGKQRSKKTSMLTTLKMLYERIFREKAEKKMSKREKMFPQFPWLRFEKFIDKARREHKIFMLYHCRQFIKRLRIVAKLPNGEKKAHYLAVLKRIYGYDWKDCYFGYDVTNGLEYDDGQVKIHLFDALEKYAQLFFIYHQTTPLDLSNLAIREDFTWEDYGNFPVFDGDLLDRNSTETKKASKYSHVIDFDAFRPGMKFDPNNPNRDAVEYGIGVVQEVDKERKNSKTRSAAGNKGDGELGIATQDNDGFEVDLKVRGQVALVDFTDFWVWLIDAQRVGDLGASNAELTNQVFIKGVAEEYLHFPLFEIEYALYALITKIYDKIHRWFRVRKGSNTLPHHLLKLAYGPIFRAYDRIEKEFTGWKLNVKVTDGGDGELLGTESFWILDRVTYRDRFASDVCKAFYEYRFARSKRGMDDIACYKATDTDVDMMLMQNSYFTEDMTVYNGKESRRKRAEQRKKMKKK